VDKTEALITVSADHHIRCHWRTSGHLWTEVRLRRGGCIASTATAARLHRLSCCRDGAGGAKQPGPILSRTTSSKEKDSLEKRTERGGRSERRTEYVKPTQESQRSTEVSVKKEENLPQQKPQFKKKK
ncbi:hypothetical protein NDU88_006876, partial [Pleurodeles waltl]